SMWLPMASRAFPATGATARFPAIAAPRPSVSRPWARSGCGTIFAGWRLCRPPFDDRFAPMNLEFPRFDSAQVLVVGDVMLDRYWYGNTSRISPEAPVPVVKVGNTEDRVGGAGNVALNIASLGAGASLVAIVGRDEAAASLRSRLDSAGIHCDFQVSDREPTITKLRVISRSQQLLRVDFEEGFDAVDTHQLVDRT